MFTTEAVAVGEKKRTCFANFSREETRLCKLAPRVNSRLCLSLSLSLSVPSLFRKACHQSTRCIVYVRARGDASRMLCFELCTPRAHRAQIPSLDNIDDTQRERMRGRTHSVAANFSLLAHSFRIDSSINLRSNSSNLLDYRPIFFHEKEKKETKKENIFLPYIYIIDINIKAWNHHSFLQYSLYRSFLLFAWKT